MGIVANNLRASLIRIEQGLQSSRQPPVLEPWGVFALEHKQIPQILSDPLTHLYTQPPQLSHQSTKKIPLYIHFVCIPIREMHHPLIPFSSKMLLLNTKL